MLSECSSGTSDVNRHADAAAKAEARVRRYTPNAIRPEDWALVAEFTRQVALDLHPVEPRRATEAMRTLSQFVVWAHRQGLPLEREAIFTPDVVERFIAVGCTHLALSSQGTRRADLRRFSMQLTRHAPWAPLPKLLRPEYTIRPYTQDEVERLLDVARSQRTPLLRRRFGALLALGLGTGCYPRELRMVTTDNLLDRHGHLCLAVPGARARIIPVTPPHDVTLAQIRQEDPGSGILGFTTKDWDRAPLGHLLEKVDRPPDCPDLKIQRLRATWLLHHLENKVHLNGLAQMAGLTSWKTFSHVMRFLSPITDADLYAELTRQ